MIPTNFTAMIHDSMIPLPPPTLYLLGPAFIRSTLFAEAACIIPSNIANLSNYLLTISATQLHDNMNDEQKARGENYAEYPATYLHLIEAGYNISQAVTPVIEYKVIESFSYLKWRIPSASKSPVDSIQCIYCKMIVSKATKSSLSRLVSCLFQDFRDSRTLFDFYVDMKNKSATFQHSNHIIQLNSKYPVKPAVLLYVL